MDKLKQKFFLKLPLALILAFLGSQILVAKVTYKNTPAIRPSFKTTVQNLPSKITSQIKKIANLSPKILPRPYLPPPWIEPELKPTIVAYKPPVYYPPTSTPRPTTPPPPTTTPLPTKIPPQKPPETAQPTPTFIPTTPPSPTPLPTQPPELPPSQKKTQLLNLINQERGKHGITTVSYNNALDQAAQAHSDDMYQNNYFNRDHSGRDGSSPSDRAERAGYGSRWVGENMAKGTTDPNSIFNMWMGSSGHRQNMLNPTWKSAGIGISSTIWVLLLGAK